MQARTDQGVRYISGGVSEDERTELNSLSNQFNLRLLFAMQGSGEYLSAVRVNILDTQGASVLNVQSKGPWFFAQLAPGDYIVEASATDQGQPSPHRQTTHIDSSVNPGWISTGVEKGCVGSEAPGMTDQDAF